MTSTPALHLILAADASPGAAVAASMVASIRWPAGTTVHVASVVPPAGGHDVTRAWPGHGMRPDDATDRVIRAAGVARDTAAVLAASLGARAIERHVLRGG